ncbi:MAG TPA: histidine phosphatase family protein [Candidatus Avipropionibacterium avicola]|uniref:Histidine phosphatase family protein n=1 Tax=Candidatus Avipropionibacterium avicola TaxID=2840701 RepID=A0A9D1KMG1_9ACTN|nr:histidine phosphatase family protein [Candidatus Avipropionibacterium avicola]
MPTEPTADGPRGASRVLLLRHGRTSWNATARFQGQADIPLDDLGLEQAQLSARALADVGIDLIWSSDLSRAHQTAQAVADLRQLPIRTDPAFREIHVGSWQGLTLADLREVDPEAAARYARGEDVRRSATGEDTAEVGERVARRLTEVIAEAPDDSTVLVGTHGLAAKAGALTFLEVPFELWSRFDTLTNCHWIDLRRTRRGLWRVQAWNRGPDNFPDGESVVRGTDEAKAADAGV